jgi:hypothetical protein
MTSANAQNSLATFHGKQDSLLSLMCTVKPEPQVAMVAAK